MFDLAWPQGLQQELTEPVVVLLNEGTETIALANRAGFRCFTTSQDFRNYVQKEILEGESAPAAAVSDAQP